MAAGKTVVVVALGSAQTLSWAATYYLPAILAEAIAADLALSPSTVFAAFSAALLVIAALAPTAGRLIDRHGGRNLLLASNLLLAVGLTGLGLVGDFLGLLAAWILLGVGMAFGLYDAAFTTLSRLYGSAARPAITGVTLVAGFASTVGWPVSAALLAEFGWRETCFAWAATQLVLALPFNFCVPRAGPPLPPPVATGGPQPSARSDRVAMWLLAAVFAMLGFVATGMASHLPRLLEATGASPTAAVAAGALIGPAQVAARLLEFGLLRRLHPLVCARLATALHPLGTLAFPLVGAAAAPAFALLHGGGNGLMTIAKGTLPLALFGPAGYGRRLGLISAPGSLAQAASPLIFGLLVDRYGALSFALSAGLNVLAFSLLFAPAITRRRS
ncbi:MAG: MFS transporter [Alphaproteobacteria bacterium]|nr:MFS transporter [Alphaproteobacteria bacterium]